MLCRGEQQIGVILEHRKVFSSSPETLSSVSGQLKPDWKPEAKICYNCGEGTWQEGLSASREKLEWLGCLNPYPELMISFDFIVPRISLLWFPYITYRASLSPLWRRKPVSMNVCWQIFPLVLQAGTSAQKHRHKDQRQNTGWALCWCTSGNMSPLLHADSMTSFSNLIRVPWLFSHIQHGNKSPCVSLLM